MEMLTNVNWVDVLIVILMLRMSYVAFQAGLSHEIFPLIGSILVTIAGLHYYPKIGSFLSQNLVNIPIELSNFLSFFILAIIIGFIFKILRVVLDKIIKVEWHPVIERFGGLIFGVARAAIVTSLILIMITLAPLPYFQRSMQRSLTGMYFLRIGPTIYCEFSGFLPAIKDEGASINKDEVMRNLTSDKSIAPKARTVPAQRY